MLIVRDVIVPNSQIESHWFRISEDHCSICSTECCMEELLRAAHIFQKIIGSTMIIITRAETNHQNIFKMESDQTKVALVSLDKPRLPVFALVVQRVAK